MLCVLLVTVTWQSLLFCLIILDYRYVFLWEKLTAHWLFIWQAVLSLQIILCLKGLHAWSSPQDPMMQMTTHTHSHAAKSPDKCLKCGVPLDIFLTSASGRKKGLKKRNPAHTVRCWLIFFNTNMLNLPSVYLQNVNTCFSKTELSRLLLGITLRFLLVKSRLSILFVKYSFKCQKCPTIHKRWYGNSVLVFGKSYFNPKCRCCSGFMVSSSKRWRKLRVNVICNYHQGWSNKYGWKQWIKKERDFSHCHFETYNLWITKLF